MGINKLLEKQFLLYLTLQGWSVNVKHKSELCSSLKGGSGNQCNGKNKMTLFPKGQQAVGPKGQWVPGRELAVGKRQRQKGMPC